MKIINLGLLGGVGTLLTVGLLNGCGGSGSGYPSAQRPSNNGSQSTLSVALTAPAQVAFVPYNDPWPSSKPRMWDISNNPYKDWITDGKPNGKFAYNSQQVTLTYDKTPTTRYFSGHIAARGLKPNFAYQLKLIGKPVYGSRGTGTSTSYIERDGRLRKVGDTPVNGDDWANEKVGYSARWWCDTDQINADDAHYRTHYVNAPVKRRHTIYAYHFIGDFITDTLGNYDGNFAGQRSYHVTWSSWNTNPIKDVQFFGPATPSSESDYGYGANAQLNPTPTTLFYEMERGRADPVSLPVGTYHCRFMITEESFHNNYNGGTNDPLGGFWKSVLISETPGDTISANDVVFTIQ